MRNVLQAESTCSSLNGLWPFRELLIKYLPFWTDYLSTVFSTEINSYLKISQKQKGLPISLDNFYLQLGKT